MFDSPKQSTGAYVLDSLGYWALLALAAVLPVCVLTSSLVPTLITKVFVGGALVLIALLFFAIGHMRSQELAIPRSALLAASWLVPVAYLLSTLFGGGTLSFMGERLSMDSAAFMIFMAVALTVTAITLKTPQRALGLYLAMLASAALLTLSEAIIFFAPGVLETLGVSLQSISLVGTLNDLAVFFGLITLFVLLSLLLLPLTPVVRGVLWLTLVAAGFFLMIVNLNILWWIIGGFALACFVYSVTTSFFSNKAGNTFSVAALAVLILSAVFLFGSDDFTGRAADWAGVGQLDVRPSWQTTVAVGSAALAEDGAVFGTGPGTFYHAWAKHMPESISSTLFWRADFPYGIGLVPTSVVTTGLLGAAAWLIFFAFFVWHGTRSLVLSGRTERGDIASYLHVTSFVGALYLWILTVIQVPSPVLVLYAALLTGVFIASQSFGAFGKQSIELRFRENPRIGFLATLVLTLLLLASVGGIYGLSTRHVAEATYQSAVDVVTVDGDVDAAYELGLRAINLNRVDVYYRLLSSLDVIRIQELVSQDKQPEEIREEFQTLLARAVANAREATVLDGEDYQNWINLGSVYQSIVPVGVDGAIESALEAYDRALELRPNSPTVLLSKATLERNRGDNDTAQDYVEQAITLRNQYTDAIFLLAQMQLEKDDVASALNSVEAITIFTPNNPVAFFQLGLLRYGIEDFVGAVQAFERSVTIDPAYANARYFLGLSYWRLGNNSASLAQFKRVRETNPDNQDVQAIIANMEAGRGPFTQLETSPDIETIDGLPIEQANDGTQPAAPQNLAE